MGCDNRYWSFTCPCFCFNPRTRMGCDRAVFLTFTYNDVSIHAPAWGATVRYKGMIVTDLSFNPRTRMGCDLFFCQQIARISRFNPRTRMGCDRNKRRGRPTHRVSIHAPAWGATCSRNTPTLHAKFQSTHPHGVRQNYQ